MTITYKELKRLVRFKEKDNNKIRFSDYEIKEATNEALRYFSNSYALQNSDFLEKQIRYDERAMNDEIAKQNEEIEDEEDKLPFYDFVNDGIELPEDFLMLQGLIDASYGEEMRPIDGVRKPLIGQYKIVGGRIYLGCQCVDMLYKANLGQVTDEGSEIEVPFMFKDSLAKIVGMILNNDATTDVMMEAIESAVKELVPRRRYTNARIRMPFMV